MGNNLRLDSTNDAVRQKHSNFKSIALVDDFKNSVVCIDFDDTPDVPHGVVVERFIKEGCPKANIERVNLEAKDGIISASTMNNALDSLLLKVDSGKKYDAVNLSQGNYMTYKEISTLLKCEITPKNISKYASQIRDLITTEKSKDDGSQALKAQFEKIDKVIAKGISVYLSAGNEGNESFNIYSLIKGVNSVGSLDEDGKKSKFSADNSLVKKWAVGDIKIKVLKDANGKIGFDYTGDGSIDIYADKTSSIVKNNYYDNLWGTSFASPKAIANDSEKKHGLKKIISSLFSRNTL